MGYRAPLLGHGGHAGRHRISSCRGHRRRQRQLKPDTRQSRNGPRVGLRPPLAPILLNRRRWRTRLELSTALFEYLEIFHNRQRRHTALGMLSPVEYELRTPPAA
ncbi:IS3 family transposase [Streptomyces sp. NPDC059378]|uniref:IS3 family transposase n=1 Tax=Streptomyces sp. NPDC059378 TaxID=3346815 RepID=UPI0036B54E88